MKPSTIAHPRPRPLDLPRTTASPRAAASLPRTSSPRAGAAVTSPRTSPRAVNTPRMPANVGIKFYEEGLECTPELTMKMITGCFAALGTTIFVVSLGILAGAIFWTAREMDTLTQTGSTLRLRFVD